MAKKFSKLSNDLARLAKEVEKVNKNDAQRIAGTEAVKAANRNFERQGFIDDGRISYWPAKKNNNSGKPILQDTNNMKDAVRFWLDGNSVIVGVDSKMVPYAQIHNEGGRMTVRITQQSRKYFWRQFYRTGDPKWKHMALTRKSQFTINIPERKFLGFTDDIIKTMLRELGIRIDKLQRRI